MRTGDEVWREKLFAGAKALGVSLTEKEAGALTAHAETLLLWNKKVNLTAITKPGEVLEKHVLDSLSILPLLPETGRVLDMGTGGGFPGIVIAIMRPDLEVLMVDSVGKKIAFVRDLIRKLDLKNARAENLRVEDLARHAALFDCIVSRAFTSLDRFIALGLSLLSPSGKILAMKGPEGFEEAQSLLLEKENLTLLILPYELPFGGGSRVIFEIFQNPPRKKNLDVFVKTNR